MSAEWEERWWREHATRRQKTARWVRRNGNELGSFLVDLMMVLFFWYCFYRMLGATKVHDQIIWATFLILEGIGGTGRGIVRALGRRP